MHTEQLTDCKWLQESPWMDRNVWMPWLCFLDMKYQQFWPLISPQLVPRMKPTQEHFHYCATWNKTLEVPLSTWQNSLNEWFVLNRSYIHAWMFTLACCSGMSKHGRRRYSERLSRKTWISCKIASLIPRPFPPPVFDRLQHRNTEGKAWEVRSRAVTSGRQRVGAWGQCLTKNLQALSCWGLEVSVHKAASMRFIVHSARDGSTQNWNYYSQALCPMCLLPDTTVHDYISQSFISVFAYCKGSKMGGGNGLEMRL